MNCSVLDWLDGSQRVSPSRGHDACDFMNYTRNNVDTSTYRMAHCNPTCHCKPLWPKLPDVLHAIDECRVPTMTLCEDQGGVRLEVSSSPLGSSGDYVAFSHVWVEGLGSMTEEGIFACKARRLRAVAEQASSVGVSWWIDSLCIPDTRLYRKKSIGQLRNVYINASKVIAIDRALGQCRADSSAKELLWELVSSAWMQRLWTYQESFLATSIAVQLQDSFLDFKCSTLPRSTIPATVQVVWTSLYSLVSSLRPDQLQEMARKTKLGEVLTALNWRTTSTHGDETLAVAALLDVDPWS